MLPSSMEIGSESEPLTLTQALISQWNCTNMLTSKFLKDRL